MADHASGRGRNTELREFLRSRRARLTPSERALRLLAGDPAVRAD